MAYERFDYSFDIQKNYASFLTNEIKKYAPNWMVKSGTEKLYYDSDRKRSLYVHVLTDIQSFADDEGQTPYYEFHCEFKDDTLWTYNFFYRVRNWNANPCDHDFNGKGTDIDLPTKTWLMLLDKDKIIDFVEKVIKFCDKTNSRYEQKRCELNKRLKGAKIKYMDFIADMTALAKEHNKEFYMDEIKPGIFNFDDIDVSPVKDSNDWRIRVHTFGYTHFRAHTLEEVAEFIKWRVKCPLQCQYKF